MLRRSTAIRNKQFLIERPQNRAGYNMNYESFSYLTYYFHRSTTRVFYIVGTFPMIRGVRDSRSALIGDSLLRNCDFSFYNELLSRCALAQASYLKFRF